jgi:ABC-type glucose/galactose transport system permease subunit
MLVVIRSGLNFVLALFNVNVNATYVTYVLTGVIVVAAILFDVIKKKKTKT